MPEPVEPSELPYELPSPSEAIFGFMGWMTCRRQGIMVGRSCDSAEIARLVGAYCDAKGFLPPREDWLERMNPESPPEDL